MMDYKLINKIKCNQIFKDSFWALLGSGVGKGLSLIAGILVARFLTKEIYGEYGIIKITLYYIAVFSTFGLGFSATRYISKYRKNAPDKVRIIVKIANLITFCMSSFMALLVVLFAKELAIALETPNLSDSLRISAIAIIFNAFDTAQVGILSGFGAFKTNARNTTISGFINFLASVSLTYLWGLEGAIWAITFAFGTSCLLNYFSIRHILKEYPSKSQDETCLLKGIIRFSFPIALQESLYSITHWATIAVFVKLSNYGELALNSAAGQWQAILLFIPGVLRNVTLSHLSGNTDNSKAHNNTVNVMIKVNFISTFIPFIFVVLLSKLISSFYGPTFSDLPVVLIVSCAVAIANCLSNVYSQELISIGKNWFLFWTRLLKDLLTLIFVTILLTDLELKGAITMATVSFCMQTAYLFALYIQYKTHNTFK